MKNKLFIFTFFIFIIGHSQTIIKSIQRKDSEYFEYEDYEAPNKPIGERIFLKGCSWYCGGNVKNIKASSELKANSKNNYSPKNAHDFKETTAWIEGEKEYGIGEYIEYVFDFSNEKNYNGKLGINKLLIANGYKKNKTTWRENSRIKKMKVYLNNKPLTIIELLDSFEIQTVDIKTIMFPNEKVTTLKFEILEVFKGEKYKDTALSLLMFEGVGVH